MLIDAHTHSTYSDGSDTPSQLILHAKQAGLDGVVVTDHDSFAHFDEVIKLSQTAPLKVWPGLEVSAADQKTEHVVHLLAYGIAPDPATHTYTSLPLQQLIQPTLDQRLANAKWQVASLQEAGYNITWEQVAHVAHRSETVFKQHIMAVLTDKPYVDPEYRQLFKELFSYKARFWRKVTYPDFRDAVRAIAESGGAPVLAHPGQSGSFKFVPELVEGGLVGIERNHPDHTPKHQRMVDELTETYGLIGTGGSDYHGKFGRHQKLGECTVEDRFVHDLCSILERPFS